MVCISYQASDGDLSDWGIFVDASWPGLSFSCIADWITWTFQQPENVLQRLVQKKKKRK